MHDGWHARTLKHVVITRLLRRESVEVCCPMPVADCVALIEQLTSPRRYRRVLAPSDAERDRFAFAGRVRADDLRLRVFNPVAENDHFAPTFYGEVRAVDAQWTEIRGVIRLAGRWAFIGQLVITVAILAALVAVDIHGYLVGDGPPWQLLAVPPVFAVFGYVFLRVGASRFEQRFDVLRTRLTELGSRDHVSL